MKKNILSITTLLLLAFTVSSFAQSNMLPPKISVSFKEITLKDLLSHLRATYHINFSYSAAIPLNKNIGIKAVDLALEPLLEKLCDKWNLTYRIIDNHVVLRRDDSVAKALSEGILHFSVLERRSINKAEPAVEAYISQPIEGIRPILPVFFKIDQALILKDQHEIDNILPVKVEPAYKVQNRTLNFDIGLVSSYDYYKFNFKERLNVDQEFSPEKSYSIGISGTVWLNPLIAASAGVNLAKKGYFLSYNYRFTNPEEPITLPDITSISLAFLQVPVNLNFRFFKKDKFSLSLSTGLTTSFMISKREKTVFTNAEKERTTYFIEGNKEFLWGGSCGVQLWYNINDSIHIFLGPDYLHYFSPLNGVIMDSNTRALKAKIGMNLNL